MKEEEILEKIIEAVSEYTDKEVTPLSHLIDDLEISSLESFVILGELEQTFKVKIDEDLLEEIVTINDLKALIMKQVGN